MRFTEDWVHFHPNPTVPSEDPVVTFPVGISGVWEAGWSSIGEATGVLGSGEGT